MIKHLLTGTLNKEPDNIAKTTDFKILSLDGGGIKGLYTATLLVEIEEKTGKLTGEFFDMICGTSTGGLMALAITNGIPCKDIAKFYVDHGPLIFPSQGWIDKRWRWMSQVFWGTKYSSDALETALEGILGRTKTMGEASNLLCIPAFNITKGRPTVFKKPFGAYHRDGRFTMLQVAMATSAAPTYLPAFRLENDQYVDGGIIANNPSLIGYTEAVDHFIGKTIDNGKSNMYYDRISLLSIGLPGTRLGFVPDARKERSFLQWKENLIGCSMQGSAQIADYQTCKLIQALEGSSYFRILPPPLPIIHSKNIKMDNTKSVAIQTLIAYGQEVGDIYTSTKWNEIEHFFKNFKSYK
jgi:predicted acylesterase/phospholipase RssA